jgi:CHAT domain-containing protein
MMLALASIRFLWLGFLLAACCSSASFASPGAGPNRAEQIANAEDRSLIAASHDERAIAQARAELDRQRKSGKDIDVARAEIELVSALGLYKSRPEARALLSHAVPVLSRELPQLDPVRIRAAVLVTELAMDEVGYLDHVLRVDPPHRRLPTSAEFKRMRALDHEISSTDSDEVKLHNTRELLKLAASTFGPDHVFTGVILDGASQLFEEHDRKVQIGSAAAGIFARSPDPFRGTWPLTTAGIMSKGEEDERYTLLACYLKIAKPIADASAVLNELPDYWRQEDRPLILQRLKRETAAGDLQPAANCDALLPLPDDQMLAALTEGATDQASAVTYMPPSLPNENDRTAIQRHADQLAYEVKTFTSIGSETFCEEFEKKYQHLDAGVSTVNRVYGKDSPDATDFKWSLADMHVAFARPRCKARARLAHLQTARALLEPIKNLLLRTRREQDLAFMFESYAGLFETEGDLNAASTALKSAVEHASKPGLDMADSIVDIRIALLEFHERHGQWQAAEGVLRELMKTPTAAAKHARTDEGGLMIRLGAILQKLGRRDEARQQFEAAVDARRRNFGSDDQRTREAQTTLGLIPAQKPSVTGEVVGTGRRTTAEIALIELIGEPDLDRMRDDLKRAVDGRDWNAAISDSHTALSWLSTSPNPNARLATLHFKSGLVDYYSMLGRFSEAEAEARSTVSTAEQIYGANDHLIAPYLLQLAKELIDEEKYEEAEPYARRAAAVEPYGSKRNEYWNAIADSLEGQHRFAEAQPFRTGSLLVANLVAQGKVQEAEQVYESADHFQRQFAEAGLEPRLLLQLGRPLAAQNRAAEELKNAKLIAGDTSLAVARATAVKGETDAALGDWQSALTLARPACERLSADRGNVADFDNRRLANDSAQCFEMLALAYRRTAPTSGLDLAFQAAQRSQQSDAGAALSKAGARTAARAAGAGALVERYEGLLSSLRLLEQAQQNAAAAGADGSKERARIEQERSAVEDQAAAAAKDIGASFPAYWELRAPRPLSIDELRGTTDRKPLLRPSEALVLLFIPSGQQKGFVAAISTDGAAWADIRESAEGVSRKVNQLRAQIDPRATVPGRGRSRSPMIFTDGSADKKSPSSFGRRIAYELYADLFGDPEIARIVDRATTLLVVPMGAMISLPPALLVTKPPTGSDDDPKAVRDTAWLIKEKAVAVLPTVSALRTLRQITRTRRATPRPLEILADPFFGSTTLPRLPGTRLEATKLSQLLEASATSVWLDRQASEAQLGQLNANGTLAQARVVSFATHGLVAGDMPGLSEPALALAPTSDEDGYLTASEATALRLNADWVLLSACNTASPDNAGARGLSGLTRSFFFAGARSVLASHWRIGDEAAEKLITTTFVHQRSGQSKAESLRAAMLQLMDDDGLPYGWQPRAWAPFVLYGDPE